MDIENAQMVPPLPVFSTIKLFQSLFFRFYSKSFNVSKGFLLSFVDIMQQNGWYKYPQRIPLSHFRNQENHFWSELENERFFQ